ncbi:hypothetical protein KoxyNG13_047760 [Klebsiella pasteurii]
MLKITTFDDKTIVEQSIRKYQPVSSKVQYKTSLKDFNQNVKTKVSDEQNQYEIPSVYLQ